MSTGSVVDHYNNDYSSHPRGFLTPPPTWNRDRRRSPVMPGSEKKPRRSPNSKADLFHVIHKVPSGDSPYVRAKHVQLIDKDPSKAISLFWAAINSGDRVDSALKDMAIVMKQLDRSDEAIEAIKSFRHLCPPESQESLDNILVEMYKQSGRIDEEIEILKLKLKQVEQGIAFGGKRTKMARSQGKKIQITVEKEYSRLLGNLAWAYMQQKDFKSAEEHYRKALSFESDKNKQCNLAVCLMHTNKLTEAKFLLQAISSTKNGHIDESYAKSYERACQMLVELESDSVLKPMKQTDDNKMKAFGGQWDREFFSQKHGDDNNDMLSSPLPLSVNKMNNGAFTEFPYEKRADFDWRTTRYQVNYKGQEAAYSSRMRAYESPFSSRVIPKVPFTQLRRFPRSRDQTQGRLKENAYGASFRKLSFESSNGSSENEIPKTMPQISEKKSPLTCQKSDTEEECGKTCEISTCERKKSWADMVEEDEINLEILEFCVEEVFNDENLDSNIISEATTPKWIDNQVGKLSGKIELIDLGSGYCTQPEKSTLSMNQAVRRSLCFDQNHKGGTENSNHCTSSPLAMKVLDFEGPNLVLSKDFSCPKSMKRRNRLQVFQDITHVPDSPP